MPSSLCSKFGVKGITACAPHVSRGTRGIVARRGLSCSNKESYQQARAIPTCKARRLTKLVSPPPGAQASCEDVCSALAAQNLERTGWSANSWEDCRRNLGQAHRK